MYHVISRPKTKQKSAKPKAKNVAFSAKAKDQHLRKNVIISNISLQWLHTAL